MSKVIEITAAEFPERVLQSALPVLVEFNALWCPPCKMMAPAFDALAADLGHQISFVKLDAEEAEELTQHYQVESLPTLVAFKDGQVVARKVGYSSRKDLASLLEQLLPCNPPAETLPLPP